MTSDMADYESMLASLSAAYFLPGLRGHGSGQEVYEPPDFYCPRCDKEAAPEHVSVFCEQQESEEGVVTVENGHRCRCWWCGNEWEEA